MATVYNGTSILAYVNGTLVSNGTHNPYPLTGGIYKPADGEFGAEFGVGLNRVNETVGGPPIWTNVFKGLLGGIGVWNVPLSDEQASCKIFGLYNSKKMCFGCVCMFVFVSLFLYL